jgi:hypothetical protein
MRGGTGRLPGRDDERDPDLYKFLLYLSPGTGCIKLLITFLITIL